MTDEPKTLDQRRREAALRLASLTEKLEAAAQQVDVALEAMLAERYLFPLWESVTAAQALTLLRDAVARCPRVAASLLAITNQPADKDSPKL